MTDPDRSSRGDQTTPLNEHFIPAILVRSSMTNTRAGDWYWSYWMRSARGWVGGWAPEMARFISPNTTTGSVLVARKSRDVHVNDEWKHIQRLLIAAQLDVTPKRVISKENVADNLSRGIRGPHLPANRVWFCIPDDLSPFLFHA
ncbi:hypothetical protein PTTG_25758 [Puccinia triticina 1-1 BBBD Race 1]|uniref:Uncharacterized protein n=1 Tax=Puccinia triticina (isolate 1-1 / race 1 (BBBD)) TaxID=630390 RepID=A0A180GZP6_PUCT1|nr:hypothetical protein PTTG_25758 [Puccinia triticina 1-1 BBBD Race 1]